MAAASTDSNIILSLPIYMQAPPVEGGDRNRHILISLRVVQVDDDNVRLEAVWNTLEAMPYAPAGAPGTIIPRRPGVQVFMPRDPYSMPTYVIITRLNRFGSRYQLGAAIHVHEWVSGIIEVDVDFLRIRRRNVRRSGPLCILHARDVAIACNVPGDESNDQDAVDGDVADTNDLPE